MFAVDENIVQELAYNRTLLVMMAGLTITLLVAMVVLTGRLVNLGKKVERMVAVVARHGSITDDKKEILERTVLNTAMTVKRAVDKVPDKTAEKTVEKLKEAQSDSSRHDLPAQNPGNNPRTPGLPLILWPIMPLLMMGGINVMANNEAQASFNQYDAAVRGQLDGRFSSSREYYLRAMRAGHDKVECLSGAAECSFYMKDYQSTVVFSNELLEIEGGEGNGRFWIAQVLLRNGKRQEAIDHLRVSKNCGNRFAGRLLHSLSKVSP